MKARKDGTIGGKGSRRAWQPKSSGTSGEIAAMKAMQEAGISYRSQAPIKTKFSPYTFLCDFLLLNPDRNKPDLILEIDGGLHFKTWKGKPAVRRMAKDEVRNECLRAEGYRVLRIRDTTVKAEPENVIQQIREALQ